MKKYISTLFILFALLSLTVDYGHARLGPKDYWSNYVKDQYMPEEIKNKFIQDPATSLRDDVHKVHQYFRRDFDPRRFDAVVYHTHHTNPKLVKAPSDHKRFGNLKED